MDIFEIAKNDLIEQGYPNVEILEISTIGSQLVRDNPKDIDYLVICKDYEPKRYRKIIKTKLL